MTAALTTLLISIIALVGYLILLRVEARRGARVFANARTRLDAICEHFALKLRPLKKYLRRHAVRQTTHYLIHLVFVVCARFFKWMSRRFDSLIRANKALSRRAVPHAHKKNTHLSAALAYKRKTTLSDEEKRTYKERAIGTKL